MSQSDWEQSTPKKSPKDNDDAFDMILRKLSEMETSQTHRFERIEREIEQLRNPKRNDTSQTAAEKLKQSLGYTRIESSVASHHSHDSDAPLDGLSGDQVDRRRKDRTRFNKDLPTTPPQFQLEYSDEENESKRSSGRRSSILRRQTKEKDEKASEVVYTSSLPSAEKIWLETLTPREVAHFYNQIHDYQQQYSQKLPIGPRLSLQVKEEICAFTATPIHDKLHEMPPNELLRVLQEMLAPRSRQNFEDELAGNIEFKAPAGFRNEPKQFRQFYSALYTYADSFLRVYEILAEEANPEVIPLLKELVQIFCAPVPYKYASKKAKEMAGRSHSDIYSWIRGFKNLARKDLSKADEAKDLKNSFDGIEQETQKLIAPTAVLTPPAQGVRRSPEIARLATVTNREMLKQVDEYLDSDEEFEDQYLMAMEPSRGRERPRDSAHGRFSGGDRVPRPSSRDDRFRYRSDMPCFSQINNGKCTKPYCKYSHDEELCDERRDQMIEALVAVRENKRKSKQSHESHEQRQQGRQYGDSKTRAEPLDYKNVNTVAMLSLYEEDLPQHYQPDVVDQLAENHLLFICPEVNLVAAVRTAGVIALDEGALTVTDVLFDNGSVNQSYIDAAFFYSHRQELSSRFVDKPSSINLAQKGKTAAIMGYLDLPMTFQDRSGKDYSALQRFWVVPDLAHQMIVGLPHIVRFYLELFFDMIQAAATMVSELSTIEPGDIVQPWSFDHREDAPEEKVFETPCSFPDALHYMEMSVEESRKEYQDILLSRIDPDCCRATEIEQFLRTAGEAAFVPQNWEGIKGTEPLELEWKDDLPSEHRTRVRRVNPALLKDAKAELDRIKTHFYRESTSKYSCGLVIAPKATKPFVRLCGDYTPMNKFILKNVYPIPHVLQQLEKISGYSRFCDLDLMTAFHQIALGPKTSAMLSIQTPWGQYEPKFLPEGVAPASNELQRVINDCFGDFEWCIAIFDNLLVLCHDFDDVYRKMQIIVARCVERNLYLKIQKCNIGVDKVTFFGYECTGRSYTLGADRKAALTATPVPQTVKALQSCLGAAQFFRPFVERYAEIAAPLHDMTKKSYDWETEPWKPHCLEAFRNLKQAMADCMSIFYPDYELDWVLRTAASLIGIGYLLFQKRFLPNGECQEEPLMCGSHKFSDQARRWKTIEQEAFAIVYGIEKCGYLLMCKPFLLETDHNNLRYMESSQCPKIQRWLTRLSAYNFQVKHIPGTSNAVADWLSRDAATGALEVVPPEPTGYELAALSVAEEQDQHEEDIGAVVPSPEEILQQVHGKRNGHMGARRTWLSLNELFPGHRIPYRIVEDFVACCPICQKDRLRMTDAIKPLVRSLCTENLRDRVGADTLTMSPPDRNGNNYIIVIVVHFSKLVFLYPSPTKEAIDTARAFFAFFAMYGVFKEIQTDPGSDFTSDVVAHLLTWLGTRHRLSLVGRHQSSGVECTNREISRHLRALVADERVKETWSAPENLCMVQHILNSTVHSETGMTPFQLHFGTKDAEDLRLPTDTSLDKEALPAFVRQLDATLSSLRDTSAAHLREVRGERTSGTPEAMQNQYQPGDFVLKRRDPAQMRPTKLSMNFEGPFEVVSQDKNDVTCRHTNEGYLRVFHVDQLKIFYGSKAAARELAKQDHDQHDIIAIRACRGDPTQRSTMEFEVEFADGDIRWLTWARDLFEALPYEDFCRSRPALAPLLFKAQDALERKAQLNRTPVTEVHAGDVRYVDLRYLGYTWYDALALPDSAHRFYLLRGVFGETVRKGRAIRVHFEATNEMYTMSHYDVVSEGWRMHPTPWWMRLSFMSILRWFPRTSEEMEEGTTAV